MVISDKLVNILQNLEGYKDTSYRDQAGVWTIGYGTTVVNGKPVKSNMVTNKIEAQGWLVKDLVDTENFINNVIKVNLTQNQFNALVSLAYNIGHNAFKKSTLLRKLNKNEKIVEDYFARWCKVTINGKKVISNGLVNRRKKEWDLWNLK